MTTSKSPQYAAVLQNLEELQTTLQDTDGAEDDLLTKFQAKEWLNRRAKTKAGKLIQKALSEIESNTENYEVFMAMLSGITGLAGVVTKITGICPVRNVEGRCDSKEDQGGVKGDGPVPSGRAGGSGNASSAQDYSEDDDMCYTDWFTLIEKDDHENEFAEAWIEDNSLLWSEKEIRVFFMNELPPWKSEKKNSYISTADIIAIANEWHDCGKNVPKFIECEGRETSHIRVTFIETGNPKSKVGTRAKDVPKDKPTMWLRLRRTDKEEREKLTPRRYKRTIRHEFGHALGLQHEHQHPGAPSLYVHENLKKYLKDKYGGSDADIDQRIKKQWEKMKEIGRSRGTIYDNQSVMHYVIPKYARDPGYSGPTKLAYEISDQDKKYIREKYSEVVGTSTQSEEDEEEETPMDTAAEPPRENAANRGTVTVDSGRDDSGSKGAGGSRKAFSVQEGASQIPVIRGADIIASTMVNIEPNQPLDFHWKDHGFKVHIPAGAMSHEEVITLCIQASLSGDYKFPDDHTLVSGVYWLSLHPHVKRFHKKVTVTLQHCASADDPMFSFITANCLQPTLPYTFKPISPGAVIESDNATVQVDHFSAFAATASSVDSFAFHSYYKTTKPDSISWYDVNITATKNIKLHEKEVNEKYSKWESGPCTLARITNESVSLSVPGVSGAPVETWEKDGWRITPDVNPPILKKELIEEHKKGRLIPHFPLKLRLKNPNHPSPLEQRIRFSGVTPPNSIFLIIDPSVSGEQVPEGASLTGPTLLELNQKLKLSQDVGANYQDFGIFLLEDENGKKMECIKNQCGTNPKAIVTAVLTSWVNGEGVPHTWKELVKVLKDCNLNVLAKKVEVYYTKGIVT